MPPTDRDAGLLWDMLDACCNAHQISKDADWEDFLNDLKLRLAVERCLEIIGEAAGKVSEEFQQANPGIPWRKIKGMRNILAHDYGRIDYELIYETVTERIPELLKALKALVPRSAGQ
jgi:uncharacterized protein with HEPN domain